MSSLFDPEPPRPPNSGPLRLRRDSPATPPPLPPRSGASSRAPSAPPPLRQQPSSASAPTPPSPRPATRLARPLGSTGGESGILSLAELDRFKNLLLFARATVEGLFAGRHRSPLPGSSAEFRDFKAYVAGDSLDHVDWRAYGRTRRLFVRRFEDETDMTAYLLVDGSASMAYAGQGRLAKYAHAARLAAALSYLMLRQGDKAALGLFAQTLKNYLPPGGTRQHLHDMVTLLEHVRPDQGTGLPTVLEQVAGLAKRRGLLILLSDLHGDQTALFDALARFAHRGFRVLLFQVLDPDELDLPAQHVARYQDMESGAALEVDAEDLRQPYRQRMQAALEHLVREATGRGIEHQLVNTAAPYTAVLEAYLGFRGARA